MYIRGVVFTNYDEDKRINWPTEFVAVPMLGHRIESLDGKHNRVVCGITHYILEHPGSGIKEPKIKIEVTRNSMTTLHQRN